MKKVLIAFISLLALSSLIACGERKPEERDKPLIVTTLFPHYDMVKHLAGDLVEVEFLLPAGVDAHSYEPSSRTIVRLKNSDLFIFTGIEIEPWVKNLIEDDLFTLDLSKNIVLLEDDDHDDHHDHTWYQDFWYWFIGLFGVEHGHHHDYDPHYWLDPLNAKIMVNDIANALVIMFPDEEQSLLQNRDVYLEELNILHDAFLDLVEKAEFNTVMHGGHNAFNYFAKRYGLEYYTPYRGFSSDAEPTPQALAEMISLMNELEIQHLFSEVLISPHVAQAITENTNASILYLYAAENIPADDYASGITFLDMMWHNYEQFKIGLNYKP